MNCLTLRHAALEALTPILLASPSLAQAIEAEHNGGPDYANPAGAATSASGTLTDANDTDWYRFTLSGGAYQIGAQPARWALYSADGMPLRGVNLSESVYVPTGEYLFEVSLPTANNTAYTLSVVPLVSTLQPLALGTNAGTTSPEFGGTQSYYSLHLSTVSRVTMSAPPGQSLEMSRGDGRLIWRRANLDVDLLPGDYRVRVISPTNAACTITYSATPVQLADLALGNVETVTLPTVGGMRLFRLDLNSACTVGLTTMAITGNPVDSILILYDENMRAIAVADDPLGYGTLARMQVPLPAGHYFVAAEYYANNAGSYQLTANCGNPFPPLPVGTYGRNIVASAGAGDVALLAFDTCSPESVEVRAQSTANFTYWTVLDASGHCVGPSNTANVLQINAPGPALSTSTHSVRMSPGRNFVVVSAQLWQPFQFTFDLQSPLRCSNLDVTSFGRSGNLCALFASFATMAPTSLSPFGLEGWTCLDIGTTHLMGLRVYSASGTATWFPCPPTPWGVNLQHADLFPPPTGPTVGAARDVHRF